MKTTSQIILLLLMHFISRHLSTVITLTDTLKGVECLNQINVSERITNCLCTVAVSEHRLTPTGLAF